MKTIVVYRFYKILLIELTTEVKAESIGASSVKKIDTHTCFYLHTCVMWWKLHFGDKDWEKEIEIEIKGEIKYTWDYKIMLNLTHLS
jgi:hypothetical protein